MDDKLEDFDAFDEVDQLADDVTEVDESETDEDAFDEDAFDLEAFVDRLSAKGKKAFTRAKLSSGMGNGGILLPYHLLIGAWVAGGIGGYALRDVELDVYRISKGFNRAKEGGDQAMREALSYAGGISLDQMKQAREWIERGGARRKPLAPETEAVLRLAESFADEQQNTLIDTEHLVLAVMAEPSETLQTAMRRYGVKPEAVIAETERIMKEGIDKYKKRKIKETKAKDKKAQAKKKGRVAAAMQASRPAKTKK